MKLVFGLSVGLCLLAGLVSAVARSVELDWNASSSPDVAGYNVYYGTTSGNYSHKVDAGNAVSVTISNLNAGATYFFAATAYDTNGNESAYSSEVSFIVPGLLTMSRGAAALTQSLGLPAAPVMQFPVEPGHWYEVQATTDFHTWTTIWQTGVAVSNVWLQFSDPDARLFQSRFYRLVLH